VFRFTAGHKDWERGAFLHMADIEQNSVLVEDEICYACAAVGISLWAQMNTEAN
jgi:hypothetical protein